MDNITYSCELCNRNFSSQPSLNAHKRSHSGYIPVKAIRCCSLLTRKEIPVHLLEKHEDNFIKSTKLIQCSQCHTEFRIPVGSINQKFCSHSCAATYNNLNAPSTRKRGPTKKQKPISYPKTKVYLNKCSKTGLLFYSKSYRKYHPSILDEKDTYNYHCQFRFSIKQFPLWFDVELIKELGWYSNPGSRKGQLNTKGVSRDHMISKSHGFLNNINPWYISHPANCQLMSHKQNQTKNSKSSLTLPDLLERIADFEKLYPEYVHTL